MSSLLKALILSMQCVLLALLATTPVMAQAERGSELAIGGSLLHFSYQELDDAGKLLDREDGYIPGVVLGLSHAKNHWLIAGDFSYHNGTVAYSGQTQSGIPITTHTVQNITDLGIRSEYWLGAETQSSYALYLGAGYHRWDRNILATTTSSGAPVNGLFEHYEWLSGFMGFKAALHETSTTRLLLDTRLVQLVQPVIEVDLGGQYNRLTLGERHGIRLSLPWSYKFDLASRLNVEPYAERYELGRSATVGGIFEPYSQTTNYGLTVGISQHF